MKNKKDESFSRNVGFAIIILIFAVILLGIFSANIAYFGKYSRYLQDETIPPAYKENMPISEGQAESIRITNIVLLFIPVIMIIVASIVLAAEVGKNKPPPVETR